MTETRTPPAAQAWMLGIGSAMLAGHLVAHSLARFQRAGLPARILLGATPLAMTGWALSRMGSRSAAPVRVPTPTPTPKRKRSVEATDAEVVAEAASGIAPVMEAAVETAEVIAPPPVAPADGVAESGPLYAERPTARAASRAGGADDLTRIKGVGPKLGASLRSLGYFHFDQVAAWSIEEADRVDALLGGIRGRIARENWVEQARGLAKPSDAPNAPRGKARHKQS